MTRKSLLKGSVWKTQSDDRRATTMAEAEEARERAFSDLVILIDDTAEQIAEQHDKPLDATLAETAFLVQLHQVLADNDNRIATHFATGGPAIQAEPQAVAAAEQRADQAEQQLGQPQANQDRLRAEARHASTLQASLDLAQNENARLQRELDQARQNADQPNPLQGRVTELEGQLAAANTAKDAAEAESTRLQGELDQANAAKVTAEESANEWQGRAVALGYVEPGSQSEPTPAPAPEPSPEPEPDIVPGMQPAPEPERRRRSLRGMLPGNRRNQGAQDGGDE